MEMTARTAKNTQMVKMISAVCSTADLAFLLPIIEFIKISIPQAACRRLPFIKGYLPCGYAHNTGKCRSDIAGPASSRECFGKEMLSVNCDQANGFDQSLALIGAEVIKQCLYFGLLLGDFTFSCHYEGSGQCVVTGLNIFFCCVYAIELQSFYGIIYNIKRNKELE